MRFDISPVKVSFRTFSPTPPLAGLTSVFSLCGVSSSQDQPPWSAVSFFLSPDLYPSGRILALDFLPEPPFTLSSALK